MASTKALPRTATELASDPQRSSTQDYGNILTKTSSEVRSFSATNSNIGIQGSATNCTVNIGETGGSLEEKCRRDLYQTSPALADPSEYKSKIRRKRGRRATGTCEWILQTIELRAWLGTRQTNKPESPARNILWLYGNPGTGKTTISMFLAEKLWEYFNATEKWTLAYMFCDSNSPNLRTAASVVRGLIHQLLQHHPPLLEYILPKYRERGASLFTSFDALWTIFTDIVADKASGRKYCIIDALDECDRGSQDELLKQLQESFGAHGSSTLGSSIRILITSRPYPKMLAYLGQYAKMDLTSFEGLKQDIDLFIRERVLYLKSMHQYPPPIAKRVERVLMDKAQGTFLWVSLACNELCDVPSIEALDRINELPIGLESLYRTLLITLAKSARWDAIKRILSFVTVSLRPLSLSELSVACQLHRREDKEHGEVDEETRIQFARDEIALCRFMVIVEDDKVRLLHQSTKDFLLSLGTDNFNELEAHSSLSNRCVDQLVFCFSSGKEDLQSYAAQFWADHAHLARSEFRIEDSAASFFKVHSECRDYWLAIYRSSIDGSIPPGFSILHVASRWGIRVLAEHALGSPNLREFPRKYVDSAHVNGDGVTPLEEAARFGHIDVMFFLLSRQNSNEVVLPQVLLAAVRNEKNGNEVIDVLLENHGNRINITDELVTAAVQNWTKGIDIVTLLLEKGGAGIVVTDDVAKAAAQNWMTGSEIMALLLEWRDIRVNISEGLVACIAGAFDEQMMRRFLNRWPDQIAITPGVINAAAGNEHHATEVMAVLLARPGNQVTITEGTVKAAAGNDLSGREVMTFLLEHGRVHTQVMIASQAVSAIAELFNEKLLALHLDSRGDQIIITEDLMKAAARNLASSQAVMTLLLHRQADITITEDMVKAAASNWKSGTAVMACLLQRRGDNTKVTTSAISTMAELFDEQIMALLLHQQADITITEGVVRAATGNVASGEAVVRLLLERWGDEITITEDMLRVAASNQSSGEAVMKLLLERRGDPITIGQDIVKAAARNWKSGTAVMTCLLQRRGDNSTVTPEAVSTIAELFDEQIMALLLDRQTDITITRDIVKAAASNWKSGTAVMTCLLQRRGDNSTVTPEAVSTIAELFDEQIMALLLDRQTDITITQDIAKAAASNWKSGTAVMTCLLQRRGDNSTVTPEAVSTMAELFDERIIALLLNRQAITEDIVEAAASNWKSGTAVMTCLLQRRGDNTTVTPEAVSTMAELFDERIIALLLDQQADITITEDVVRAAAGNVASGEAVVRLLLERRGDKITITEDMLRVAASNQSSGEAVMRLLLDRGADEVTITKDILRAAAGNGSSGEAVMTLLLHRRGDEITITEDVVMAAAGNMVSGEVVMTLLLERWGDTITITEDILTVAASNQRSGEAVMTLLLNRRGDEVTITEDILTVAASNQRSGEAVMTLLLNRRGDEVTITEDILTVAASNQRSGEAVMTLLLNRRGDEVTITEDILRAAAGNGSSGEAVMTLLLNRRGDEVTITEDILRAAAGNGSSGEAVMTLLLNRRGDEVTITEDVVRAAAGNMASGEAVMTLLLDRRGDEVTITKGILRAAAGNGSSGEAVMTLLLNRWGDAITITEDILRAAAGNESSGEAVMTLLLNRRGDEVTITEDILTVAASNQRSGEAVMTLLLNRRGDDITITEDVVRAAAGNMASGEAVMTLLLDRRGDEVTITKGILRAAAGNGSSGEAVMTLLLSRRGDEITVIEDMSPSPSSSSFAFALSIDDHWRTLDSRDFSMLLLDSDS